MKVKGEKKNRFSPLKRALKCAFLPTKRAVYHVLTTQGGSLVCFAYQEGTLARLFGYRVFQQLGYAPPPLVHITVEEAETGSWGDTVDLEGIQRKHPILECVARLSRMISTCSGSFVLRPNSETSPHNLTGFNRRKSSLGTQLKWWTQTCKWRWTLLFS